MSFFNELKRRNVIRVGIAYAVVGWLVSQVAEFAIETFGAPDWVLKIFVVFVLLGFPIVLLFAWAFEMTPEGLKLEKNVDRSQSIAPQTGKKLNNTILVLMALAIGYLLFDKFSDKAAQPGTDHFSQQTSSQTTDTNEKSALSPVGATSGDNSIAVLPFANRSDEKEDLYFTDGIHDDLLTQLANIKGLKVISRTSVMAYRDTTKRIPEIAAELGVSTILEGGIQRAGKRIRINAQLIDVATDEHLWAETFDREMTVENIFDIQSEITRHIVTAVRGELTAEETDTLAQRPTADLDAYEAYLKAKAFLNDPLYSPDKYINAEVWLKQAVTSDPGFALAWSLLVAIHGQAIWQGYDDSPERYQAALDALTNAEKYGPGLPETLAAKAEYLYRTQTDYRAAEPLFAQASQAKPGDSDLLTRLATTERRTGHFEQAITHYQMAIDLDPANLEARTVLLDTLVLMGAYKRAEPLADLWSEKYPATQTFKTNKVQILLQGYGDVEGAKTLLSELEPNIGPGYVGTSILVLLYNREYQGLIDLYSNPPMSQLMNNAANKVMALDILARAYLYMGDNANAEKYTQAAIQSALDYNSVNPSNQSAKLDVLAHAYARIGQFDEALAAVKRTAELRSESDDSLEGPQSSITRAMVLGMAGEREESLAEIERLLNTPAGLNRWDLALSPDWDFFRDDARFNELAQPPNRGENAQ
jgi:TolB-like protein/tetratricopeptide (TPR) repeat protein